MKKIIMISLVFISGCSYFSKKTQPQFSDSITLYYDAVFDKDTNFSGEAKSQICQQASLSLFKLMAKKELNASFYDDIKSRCSLYIYNIKEKDKKESKDNYNVSFKFDVNLYDIYNELGDNGNFNKMKPKFLFFVNSEAYDYFVRSSIKFNGFDISFKKYGDDYQSDMFDYIIYSTISASNISSSVSNVFFSSASLSIFSIAENKKIVSFSSSATSTLSQNDSYIRLFNDIFSNMDAKKNLFDIKYYEIRFYNITRIAQIENITKILSSGKYKFYIDSFNSDYLAVKIVPQSLEPLEQIASNIIRQISDISIESINDENRVLSLSFTESGLKIIS
ncbi:MAG: hypothetical protein KA059_07370 [Elusimicrobiales bacterium]|nr:hypothetical protein [Elusimicrobiales bacterium]